MLTKKVIAIRKSVNIHFSEITQQWFYVTKVNYMFITARQFRQTNTDVNLVEDIVRDFTFIGQYPHVNLQYSLFEYLGIDA